MTTNTKSKSRDRLDAPHDQPAKSTPKATLILRAIHACIKRGTSCFYIDRGIGLDTIAALILMVVFVIQGVLQWLR